MHFNDVLYVLYILYNDLLQICNVMLKTNMENSDHYIVVILMHLNINVMYMNQYLIFQFSQKPKQKSFSYG